MKPGLLATKLRCPPLSPKRVSRPRLTQQLNAGLESGRQITLVSAPAGFGKTACVSAWVDAVEFPVAWLSLDAADDEPGRFFTYFIAALQAVHAGLGNEIEGVLRAGQLPPAEVISTTLINEISELGDQFLLALDDFQVIQDRFILQVMETLVTNLPPALHLVLLTREDPPLPLARLRANNRLTEIRAEDLRFSNREAEHFLNAVMGLSLSPADVGVLEERTEGWIVGLQLAAIALGAALARQSAPDPAVQSDFITTLSGSHRFILSYLTEEVLNQQPEEVRLFLLQTAILDRLNGDLCDAVTGRTDGHAVLEELFNANLFLTPLDDEGHWYRYHQLFAELLRDLHGASLKDETAALHQRASQWYAQADMPSEAIQHALAAEDYAAVVNLLEDHALDMMMGWHIKTVEKWMQSIPPAWAMQSPRANLAFAWTYIIRGAFSEAMQYLERLQAIFADPQMDAADLTLKAEWLALQAMLLTGQGKAEEGLALANQALALVPDGEGHVSSMIYLGLANAYQQMNDYPNAAAAYDKLIQHGRVAGDVISELLGISGMGLMALEHGQLHYALEIASRGVELVTRSGLLPPIISAVYGELGQVYYHWYQLERAHHNFLRSTQVSALSGFSDAEIYHGVILSRLTQLAGDLEGASVELQKVLDLMQTVAPARVADEVASQQIRIRLAQGRLPAAEAVLAARLEAKGFALQTDSILPDIEPDQDIHHPLGLLYNSALRIVLYRGEQMGETASVQPGIELANQFFAAAMGDGYLPLALETLLLRAQLHAVLGDKGASLADVTHALELAEPEGFISIFVEAGLPVAEVLSGLLEQDRLGSVRPDYVRDILAAFAGLRESGDAGRVEQTAATLIVPLTDRELDVLRLMVEGLKYAEIAEKLFVSLNTVRSHVKAIYGKLGVDNRVKAIERARELGILRN